MCSCAKYPTYNMVCNCHFLPFRLKYPFSVSDEESSDLQAHNTVFLIMVYRNVIFPLSTPNIYAFLKFIFISWKLITLQYCSGFCHTLT